MRKSFILIITLFTNFAISQTNVNGVISSNTTWTKANSPYTVTGNIQVNVGNTLSIEPGVTINFSPNTYLKVLGNIIAQGTLSDSIIFKSANNEKWSGIQLISSSTNINSDYTYSSGSIFKYVRFDNSSKALFIYNSSFYVEKCYFTNNTIGIEPRSTSKSLLKSSVFNSNVTGIYTEYEDYSSGYNVSCIKDLKIELDTFINNTYGANINMNQRTFDNLQFLNNYFKNNSNGLMLGGGGYGPYLANVLIKRNIFYKNSNGLSISNIYSNGYNGCAGTLDFPLIIEKNIIDANTSSGLSFSYSNNSHSVRNNIISNNEVGVLISGTTSNVTFYNNNLIENRKTIQINGGGYYEPSNILFRKNYFKNSGLNISDYIILNNVTNNTNRAVSNNFDLISSINLVKNFNRGEFNFDSNRVVLPTNLSNIQDIIYDINDDVSLGEVKITNSNIHDLTSSPIGSVRNLRKSISGSQVVLLWDNNSVSDLSGSKIYYGGYTGYSYSNVIDAGIVSTYTLPAGVGIDEDIAVTNYDASKDGIDDQYDGNESWYSTANKVPNSPTNLIALASGHKIKLNWDISTSNGVNNYIIYRSTDGINFSKLASTNSNSYTNNGLTAYTKYYYKVSAFDSLDLSYDNYGLESPLTESIFATPTNVFYVDSALGNDLSGIGSSNSPYKKISTAVNASISGDTILVGNGTYLDNVILTKKLTIIAQSSQKNTIVKPLLTTSQIFNFTSGALNSKLYGFTITGGGNVRGSAIDCNFSSPIIENCIITNNGGEAPIHFYYTDAVINNCLIYRNTGNNVFFYDPNDKIPTVNHSTIVYNTGIGTGTSNISLIPVFTNCIIHGNTGGSTGGNINVLNSIVQGGYLGNETNVNANPSFLDSTNNDYHLSNFSPAIGLGLNTINILKDFDGNSRILPVSSNPDAGAFETIFDHPAPFIIDSSKNGYVNIKINQIQIGGVNKLLIYKSIDPNPNFKSDSTSLLSSYVDSSNQYFNTPLYYRISSKGASNIESGFSNEIRTIAFTAPVLKSPYNNSVKNDLSVSIRWGKIPNATKYKIQFSKDSSFVVNVEEINQVDTFFIKSGLIDNTSYFWRVQTWDSIHHSVWSDKYRFQTFILPPNFNTLKMGNKLDTLSWSVANSENLKYFKIYRDTVPEPKILLDSIAGNKFSYIDTSNLNLGVKYFYRIIAGNKENLESEYSNILNGIPFNRPPLVAKLSDKIFNNVGEFNSIRATYSAVGSKDIDGNIKSYKWFVNDSLVNNGDSILIYYFKQGINEVKLIVADNQDAIDSSTATVSLSSFTKTFKGGFLGGVTAISPDRILTADSTFDPINGASVYMLDRSGNTIFPLIVSSKIFTTPSVSSDSSIFITSGSSLNGFNKSGAPLWPTIPLGGNSFVTPTVDSLLSRIYLGVSNKNFFAIDYKTGKVAWNIIGDDAINASAVITGDRKLVFTSLSGTLYGFDIRSNNNQTNAKWKYSIGEVVSKSPAVDASNNLYIGTEVGNLLKLSLNSDSTVTKIWSVKLSGSIQSSAIIDADGYVYIGNEKGDFYKINPLNGSIIWVHSTGAAIRSTPAMSDFSSIYFANMNGLVTALSTDKTIKWKFKEPSPISANLLYINNMIYVGTESGKLFSIYDNPSTNTVNTSLSIEGTPSYIETNKIKSMATTDSLSSKKPIWGTFQGNYRRSGSRNFDCPEIPVVKVPFCTNVSDSIRISTNDMVQKYWVVNDKNLDVKDTVLYVKSSDKVKIIAYNSNGCNVSSSSNYLIPNSDIVKPLITTNTGSDKFCQNDSITMSSSISGAIYQWNFAGFPISNAKGKSLTTNLSGAYSVSVTNLYGCKSTSDISLIMSTSKPETPFISRDTSGNLVSSAINGNQWYKGGNLIPGANSRTYKPITPDFYTVSTNNYGCVSALSPNYYFLITDVINLSANEFLKLAPNPFNSQLNLDFLINGYQKLNIDIYELSTGRLLFNKQGLYPGTPILLGTLSSGTYIVRVYSTDGKISYQFKMVKL